MKKKEYISPKSMVKVVNFQSCLLVGSPTSLDSSSATPSAIPDTEPYTGSYSAKEMIDFILDQVN
jgi:hypothetical protein